MKAIREENSEMPKNFDNELCKWALECKFCIFHIIFKVRTMEQHNSNFMFQRLKIDISLQ